jgi:hypothetical protein
MAALSMLSDEVKAAVEGSLADLDGLVAVLGEVTGIDSMLKPILGALAVCERRTRGRSAPTDQEDREVGRVHGAVAVEIADLEDIGVLDPKRVVRSERKRADGRVPVQRQHGTREDCQ